MIESKKVSKVLYGGDYNPEQWPEEIWEEDMRLFKEAKIDVVTLNVFSWAMLQPNEEKYDFSKLDKIMKLVKKNNINVCMATSTAAHPAWMARKYDDILRVEKNGMKRRFGSRHNSCPNSPTYRKFASKLVEKLAKRYKDYDNIVAWHVSNEYGGECYCDNCAKAFRKWAQERYGTIEKVNDAWNMSFWGHTLYDFDDIVPADFRSEEFMAWDRERSCFQGISLDYKRFNSDSMLECFKLERDILKKITPEIPVTTNLMGWYKTLDYMKWAKEMDFVSWDNYPGFDTKTSDTAAIHDTMRGLKGGKPFCLMEQTPGVTNWHPYCKLKRPGVMRLWSYQALAHGSDTVMFFQMRRSQGASEKYHSAVIDHVGTNETRVFNEIKELGIELEEIGSEFLGTRTNSKVAIVFDWENWWACELSAGPSILINYINEISSYYRALYTQNISVDIIGVDDDISKYSLVIAPMLYMNKSGYDDKIRRYVENGGNYITSFFSGYVDENDKVLLGGYPGKQKDILGIWVEESDALTEEESNSFIYKGTEYPSKIVCDIIHLRGGREISTYEKDFYSGTPVLTENKLGNGRAFYVGTHSSDEFYSTFLRDICQELFIEPVLNAPRDVEVTCRENEENKYIFILNHKDEGTEVRIKKSGTNILTGEIFMADDIVKLEKKGVAIIKSKK